MATINQLRDLYLLKKLSEGKLEDDVSKLEEEFLRFSHNTPKHSLIVNVPKMYEFAGDENKHAADALKAFGIDATPTRIDISGAADRSMPNDLTMFISTQQVNADHISGLRSYLNPLIEQVYAQATLLRDFTLHEALIGKVVARRDGLDLVEAPLFPHRFSHGPYTLAVDLDTPLGTVKRFLSLHGKIAQLQDNPKTILDPSFNDQMMKEALELRGILGSLSRYDCPQATTIEASAPSVVIRQGDATIYYLWANEENIMVHFGESPYQLGEVPTPLQVINGNEHQHTLSALVQAGVYDPSPSVLDRRIKDFTKLYDESARMAGRPVSYAGLDDLLVELKRVQQLFKGTVNPDMHRRMLKTVRPEALEFMVCPSSDDPVAHELLPRLSWNKALREYHNPEGFIKRYTAGDDAERVEMLNTIASSAVFSYQQNNDVNLWLYQNSREFVTMAGVEFQQ